jgi:hypothetical protein
MFFGSSMFATADKTPDTSKMRAVMIMVFESFKTFTDSTAG